MELSSVNISTVFIYALASLLSIFFISKANKLKNNASNNQNVVEKNKILKTRKLYIALSLLPLLLLVAFRAENVGTDTVRYQDAFERIVDGTEIASDLDWLSAGYIFICKTIGFFFGKNLLIYNLVIAFLTLFFMFLAIEKTSKNETLSLEILICTCLIFQMMNQSRQLLAISIIFYAITFIIERKMWRYIIFVLLATSIHKSAIIMLPFYWISSIDIKKITYWFYSFLAITIFYVAPYIELFLTKNTYYGYIYERNGFFEARNSSLIILAARILILIFCIMLSRYIEETNKQKSSYKTLMSFTIWSTILQILTTRFYIFGRITTYFYIPICIFIPNLIEQNIRNNKKYLRAFTTIAWIVYGIGYFLATCTQSGIGEYYLMLN